MTEPHVNWVVEARRGRRPWITMANAGDDETAGRGVYADWLKSKARTGSSMEYRLVRRTAVITDEVVDTTEDTSTE